MKTEENQILCPDCGEIIICNEPQIGDIMECGECGTEVEITGISPIIFKELLEEK